MLGDVPRYVPGGPSSFHKTDIASFRELYDSVHLVYAQCLPFDKTGWIEDGKILRVIPYNQYTLAHNP